jgi:hypothetical protein
MGLQAIASLMGTAQLIAITCGRPPQAATKQVLPSKSALMKMTMKTNMDAIPNSPTKCR